MPSTSSCTSTFSLRVTLGYGSGQSVEGKLNKSCKISPPSTGSLVESLTSTFFSTGTGTTATSKSSPTKTSASTFFVASASHLELSMDDLSSNGSMPQWNKTISTSLMAVLLPPSLVDEGMEKYASIGKIQASGSCFWIKDSAAAQLQQDLLSSIDPLLIATRVIGIIRTSIASEDNAPAEWLLLEVPKGGDLTVPDFIKETTGHTFRTNSTQVLKILPLSEVHFEASTATTSGQSGDSSTDHATRNSEGAPSSPRLQEGIASTITTGTTKAPPTQTISGGSILSMSSNRGTRHSIPTCAVCLHRLDPIRLGLPTPSNDQLCSKFCPPPNLISWRARPEIEQSCPKQKLLLPWDDARCKACRVIKNYWQDPDHNNSSRDLYHSASSDYSRNEYDEESGSTIYCKECSMHKTLWVCLTCGFVGCGRYSNKHSVQHFHETGHPYSLELATLRIWDYAHEDRFSHRTDLLECPCCPPLVQPWASRGGLVTGRAGIPQHQTAQLPPSFEKTPKKATMIGQEYEALLESALGDQALHYEGEISRLRAELTSSLVDPSLISPKDRLEVEGLQSEIAALKRDIDQVSRSLLEGQKVEAQHRATSQSLLREQQEANALIQKIEHEARQEAQQGKLQVEDLEQQVHDLTANLKMRQQFSQSEELNNAQIFGTTEAQPSNNRAKRGKKKGRFFRK